MRPVLPDKVLLLHNRPAGDSAESVAGVLDQVKAVERVLRQLGVSVDRVGVASLPEAAQAIASSSAPVVFNLVEAFGATVRDRAESPTSTGVAELVPALCLAHGKGFTGNDTGALLLTLDKWRTKAVLAAAGIPTPPGLLVTAGTDPIRVNRAIRGSSLLGRSPCIIKPVCSDASEGITTASVIATGGLRQLNKQIARIHQQFGQAALVEDCVGDREINVALYHDGKRLRVLPLAEIDFSRLRPGEPRIVDYDAKWKTASHRYKATRRVIPAPVPKALARRIREAAKAAWQACGCRHYARVDLRLGSDGELWVLEVNANPDISPDAGFAAALKAGGVGYGHFIRAWVLQAAFSMSINKTGGRGRVAPALRCRSLPNVRQATAGPTNRPNIRHTGAADRPGIVKLLKQPRYFKKHEVTVGLGVFDDATKAGPRGHYQSFVVERRGRVAGWICFGETPCTKGTYDIYWLAVDPAQQGKGLGRSLVHLAESRMRRRGGRWVLFETSGRADYRGTQAFYRRIGYQLLTRLPDFYAPGDDKLTYGKKLG